MNQYKVGRYIVHKNKDLSLKSRSEIIDIQHDIVTLKDSYLGDEIRISTKKLDESIFLGNVYLAKYDERTKQLITSTTMDFGGYSDSEKKKAARRFSYVEALKKAGVTKYSEKHINPVVTEFAKYKGDDAPPSWRTIIRWKDWYKKSGIIGLINQDGHKGNRISRRHPDLQKYIEEAIDSWLKSEKPTKTKVYETLKNTILLENSKRTEDEKVTMISLQSFSKILSSIPEYTKMMKQHGKQVADKKFREHKKSGISNTVDYILECAEIDHTVLDLFVVDDVLKLPLGRPRITMIIDWKSKCILGYYIGFEDVSYISVAKAIKSAISDKTELLAKYPNIKNSWPCRGKFLSLSYDRGREFESNLLADALFELEISGTANPAGKPWNKGSVESFFNSLNKKFLVDMPGKVFADISDSNDYNPEKNAVITLTTLREQFLKWVVDIYLVDSNSTETRIPIKEWEKDEPYVGINVVDKTRLELIFCENITRQILEKGITYKAIWYDSSELLKLRMQGIKKVKVKIDRDDLGFIYVLDEDNKIYFKVPAIHQDITSGISLKQYSMMKSFAKKNIRKSVDREAIAEAFKQIREAVDNDLLSFRTVTKKLKAAQILGVGKDPNVEASLRPNQSNDRKPSTKITDFDFSDSKPIKKLPKTLDD